jgi:hypothetical protein
MLRILASDFLDSSPLEGGLKGGAILVIQKKKKFKPQDYFRI